MKVDLPIYSPVVVALDRTFVTPEKLFTGKTLFDYNKKDTGFLSIPRPTHYRKLSRLHMQENLGLIDSVLSHSHKKHSLM